MEDYSIIKTLSFDYEKELINKTRQSVVINNDIVYVSTLSPNIITAYKLDGTVINHYNIPDYIDNLYWTGEIQGMDINENNEFYGITYHNTNYDIATITNIVKFSLEKNCFNEFQDEYTLGNNIIFYVDNTSKEINPNGSSSNKFKEMYEAIETATSPLFKNRKIRIEGVSGQTYEYFVINNMVNLIVANGKISCSVNASKVEIVDCVIYQGNKNQVPIEFLNQSIVDLTTCTYEGKGFNNLLCRVNRSKLKLLGNVQTTFDSDVTAYILEYGAEFYCRPEIENINFASPNVFIESRKYLLTNQDLNAKNGIIEYNNYMKSKGLKYSDLERFNDILVEYEVPETGYSYYERIKKNNYVNVKAMNMADGSNVKPLYYETTLSLDENGITILHNKYYSFDLDEFNTDEVLMIKNIWLCY